MVELERLVAFLNEFLKTDSYEETAINGLQVDGKKTVHRVAFAVDGVLATFQRAAEWEADLLIVHHGIFWGHQWPLRGPDYRRVKVLLDASCALYAAHLPLDAHPVVGHAAVLLQKLGVDHKSFQPFGNISGQIWGLQGRVQQSTRDLLVKRLETMLGDSVRVLPFGPEEVTKVACVTGQGADFQLLHQVVEAQIDFYVTGEGSHPIFHFAREHGINLALGGHYRTETLGIRALQQIVENEFQLETTFFDLPTNL